MASPSPFNTGRNYGPGIGYRGSNTGGQSYPRPYMPSQRQQAEPKQEVYEDPEIQRAKNVAKSKRSGAFDVVRQRYNKAAAREGKQMDEEGNIVGLDSTPTQTLYAKTPTGRYKPAAKVPLAEASEPTQEELDAQRKRAIKDKYAKGQSVSDDSRLEAGLPDTPRLSSADIAAARARKEQAEVIAAQEAEQAAAREAALATSKEKRAAEVNTHKAYANSLKTKLMLAQKALAPLEAAEKAAQTNLALPKPDKAALLAARTRHDAILKQVDEADTKVLESSLAYQKHLDAAAEEGAKIDVFKAGIKTRKARNIAGITVNTKEAQGTHYDTTTGRIVSGNPSTEAKPDPQQPNIFRNTVEDENSPQNVDKNSASDLLAVNDPAKIKASKVMQQRMQLAMAEEDPNVRHYAQKDVEARMADPVKWEAAQYATMQEISDEDLAGKLQLMPQVIAAGQALLQQSQADAQAEQELYQQRLEIIAANNAKDKDKPFSMADTKVNTATGERWHTAHLNNYEATIKQANEAQAKALELLKTDENELNRDVAIHNARIIEAKRREDSKKAVQDKKREGVLRGLEAEGKHGLAGDLALINAEQKEKADQINPFIERGSDEHRAAQAVIEEETQGRIDKAVKEAAALPAKASELYKTWGRDANNSYTNWITNESPYDHGRSKDDSASTTEGYVKDVQRRKDLLEIQASKLGVNPKDLAYQLETQRILDWSKPLTEKADIQQNSLGNETAKKFGYIGEVEPTRTLPNGDVTVNPALGADQAEFDAAIKAAPASKEGKEAARKMWPAYHEAWLEKARETLSGADTVPGVEGYNDWVHRNIEAGWLTKPDGSLMSQNEQTQKYVDAMKGRGNFRKLLDNVGSSLLAGSHDIMTAIYGTGAIAAGVGEKLTGHDSQISELFSTVAADKSAQSERLMQAKGMEGTDTMFGSKLLGGAISQTARILPGMALTMATGSMGGAMLAGAMQTGGMQYADTYRTLIDQGYDHEEAWAKSAPAATYSGVMTAILTKAFPGGITALNNKANQAVLRQSVGDALKSYASGSARAMHAIARGALDEIPQETMDEFNSQMSQAMVEGKTPKQAVASFIANLPELIISTGIAGGLGGLGDMGGKADAQPGTNTPTGIKPEDLAAINTAIKGYTGGADATPEETTRTRNLAAALVKIKAGTKLAGLTQTELAAVGYERKADKIVPIKDAPQAAYEQDGNVIVTDAAIQEVTDAIPATNILGLKPESERLDEINNPPKAEASKATPESEPSNTDMSKEQAEAPKTGSEEWLQAMPESELDTKIASAANVVNKAATMATQDGGDEGFRNIAELAQNNLNRLRGEKARRQAAPPVSSDPHAQLKANGGDVVHVADHAAAEKLAGRPVQKGRRAFTQRINGKPTVVVIDSEVASQKQRGGEAEMMAEEVAHAQTMLDEDSNQGLADEADAAMADDHPDFDPALDAFMRANYNGYHKLSNRQKRYEAVAKIVNGEYKGKAQGNGIIALLKDMLAKLLKRDPKGSNAAIQKIASNVRSALGIASVDASAHEAATSPLNDKPQPTAAQKQAGNYPMGKLNIGGLSISIENPSGSTRDWKNEAGESGTSKINGHYGYIKGTVGHDGDHIDVLVKEGTPADWDGTVYVIKQLKSDGKTFDEDKVYIGFASEAEAKAAYRSNYQKGWRGYGGAIPVMMKDLAGLVKSGKLRKSPSTKSNARPTQQPAAVSTKPSEATGGQGDSQVEGVGVGMAGKVRPTASQDALAPIEAQLNEYIATLKSNKDKADAIYLRNKLLAVLKPYLATGLWTRVIVNATVPRSAEAANAGIGMGVLLNDKQTLTIHPQLLLDYAHQALQAEGRAKADEMIERGPFHELAHTLDPNSDQEASDLWNLVDEKTQRAFAESYFQGIEEKTQREARVDSWVKNKAMHAYAGREYFRAQLEKALLGSISEEVVANKALAKKLYAMIQALARAINDFASTLKDKKLAGEITAKMNAAAARFLSKLPPEVQADIRAKASREGRTLPVAQSLPAAPRPAVGKAPPSQRIAIGKGMAGDSSFAEFASERDALAYRWYSNMRAAVSPGKNQDPKAASARAASALATVGQSLKRDAAELRDLLTAYNKAVREQAKGAAEGEAFHAPRLEDFMHGGEQQMTQPRAKAGGEVGPNGEWYSGGAFIATKDLPKKIRDKITKLASTMEQVEPGYGKDKMADIPAGKLPIVARIIGSFMGPTGELNRQYMERSNLSPEYTRQLEEASTRYKAGERLLSVNDFPLLGNYTDAARLIEAGLPVPEQLISKMPQDIVDIIRAKQTTPVATASEATSNEGGGINGPRPAGGSIQAVDTPTLTNNAKKSSQNMAAPAAMEARKQIQSDFDEAKREAEEDGSNFDEQRFIYDLRDGDLEAAYPDIYSDFFGNPETTNQIVYHHTPDENTESIIENGVGAMSKTRGLNNRGVRAAVFTSAEPDPMNSYGDTVVAIDLGAARKLSGVSTSLEPAIAESIRRAAVSNMLGIEASESDFQSSDSSGETPDTLIIHGSVPKQAIQVSNKDGEVLFTGSAFGKTQAMAAPSYRSPADMLAATKAQMQGGAGEKPAGLASMFNPQAKRPATGERTLFEMPKQSVENIHAAYDSAVVGKSSAYITLDELYDALKAKEPSATPQQMADMLRKMDENGEASLEISEDSATTARNLAKYGLRMGTVPASGVAIHPRESQQMAAPFTASVEIEGKQVKTGTPITFNYLHNKSSYTKTLKSNRQKYKPSKEDMFDRGYEPSGQYMVESDGKLAQSYPDDYKTGKVTFENPIVIEAGTYGEKDSWKRTLSDYYGDKTGKRLSMAVLMAGHDGIITVSNGHTGEIVDLTSFDPKKAMYMAAPAQNNLAVIHNISEAGLRHALKIGGLAAPSVAIIRSDRSKFTGFGGISLLASHRMIDPQRDSDAKVFNTDAYSPRYPSTKLVVKYADRSKIMDIFRPYYAELQAIYGSKLGWTYEPHSLLEKLSDRGFREMEYSNIARYAHLRDTGKLDRPTSSEVTLNSLINNEEARNVAGNVPAWVESKLSEGGVDLEDKIMDGYTYSGKQRLIDHNLANVLKILKRKLRDGEGFNYGVPSIRAATAKQFKKVSSIQADRDKIVTAADMESLKEQTNAEFSQLADEAKEVRNNATQGFGWLDQFSDDLKAMIQGGSANWKYLRDSYGDNIEIRQKMAAFIDKLKHMPTEYFEGKIRRIVAIQEFDAAVVPGNLAQDLRDGLKRKGIAVTTYPSGDEEARSKAIADTAASSGLLFMSSPMPQRVAFYSKLAQVIEAKMPVRADAKAVRGMIGNQSSGVKAEEIKWSGINQWLEGKDGLIEKADVLAYLNGEGAVRFVEHRLGGPTADEQKSNAFFQAEKASEAFFGKVRSIYGKVSVNGESLFDDELAYGLIDGNIKVSDLPDDLQSEAGLWLNAESKKNNLQPEASLPSKYSQYQLPGGENYREVVLAMPVKADKADPSKWTATQKDGKVLPWQTDKEAWALKTWEIRDENGKYIRSLPVSKFPTVEQAMAESERMYNTDLETNLRGTSYTSSHFTDVPNYVAHARLNDRTDSEGQPGTFIEEIQSDRHQQAREHGYKDSELVDRLASEEAESRRRVEAATEAWKADETDELWEKLRAEKRLLASAVDAATKASNEGIPDAPYRTSWPLQMFKRALAEAVSTGKKWVGWTMGQAHTDRWGTERIEWKGQDDGSFLIDAKSQHGGMAGDVDLEGEANARNMNAKNAATVRNKAELIEAIKPSLTEGQDPDKLGEKLWTRMQTERAGVSFPRKEGFEGFYDNILPKEVAKYVKQWGGAVKEGMVQSVVKSATPSSMDALLDELDDDGNIKPESYTPLKQTQIWRVDINDAMKAGVEAGQALFMAAPSQQQQANIDAATYDFARPAPPEDPGHIRNARYINKRGLQSNPQLPLVSAFYATNSLRAKMGQTIRSFENDWEGFFDFINDQLPAEKRKAGLRKIVNKFAMGDRPEAKALWKAYAAMPMDQVLPADSERVKEAKELLPYLENLTTQMMAAPRLSINMEEMELSDFNGDEEDDGYLYHVTTKDRIDDIVYEGNGLIPNAGGQFQGAAAQANSKGRIFLTEKSGVPVWAHEIEQQLLHSRDYDEDQEPSDDLTVVRVPRSLVTGLQDDFAEHPALNGRDYFTTSPIPASPQEQMMGVPKDQGDLDSRVLKRLADQLPEDEYLDQLDTAHSESFPEGSEGDWLRALQKENTTPDTVKAWDKAARKMIAADPQAVIDEIVNNFYEGKSFGSPELALAGSILSADVLKQAQLSGDEAQLRKARAFSYAVGAGETQAGRELRALNNPHKSNRERVAEVIANLFTTPPPAIRARIANAPSPSAKLKKIAELQKRIKELEAQIVAGNKAAQKQADVAKKELEATLRTQDKAQLVDEALAKREKKVKEALANEGLTVEDVLLTPDDRLAAQDSEIVQRARAKHTAAQQKALLWIGRGFSDTDVAKFSGMERGAVATLREDYRNNSLKPEIAKEIKGGRSILEVIKDSFKKAFGINMAAPLPWSNVQRVQPTPPKPPKNKTVQPPKVEDTVADEIDRMLDILAPNARAANGNSLLAAVVKGKNGTRVTIQVPFDADDFKSVYRVARAISISEASGFDKMYEYWINNLLSGPQTNFVNIIGNTLSVGIQYLAQRPLETAVNLFTRDDQSAQLGEWEYIAKGVATGLGEAWQNAVLAFSVEADPTAHRYLNEPMHIGFTPSGDVAKMGGYRGPSVKGFKGRVIRIPGRLLRMMDAMFKTFILHAEVGAMAYRLGKIEQRAGRIGATGADLQAFIQDQIATKGSKSWMMAMRTATDLTFQDENWLTDIAKNFTQGADKFVDKRRADAAKAYAEDDTELGHSMELRANAMYFTAKLMSIIFPFVRTPSNILRMGVRKSPLGSLLLPLHFIQMIRQGITNKIKGKDFLESYPKGVLVKLLAEQTLAWMVTMGLMSAIEGDDDDDKKRFIIVGGRPWKDSGATDAARRDYGGTYLLIWRNDKGEETRIPFGRYEPVATLLGTTADAVRRLKERARRERNGEPGANMEDAVKALMGDFVNQAGDKSFLQGIAGVMKEIESLENSGDLSKGIKETAWKATLSAIVPNLIRQVMRNTDDKVRDSKKKGDWYDAFPMGSNAEPVIDLFGRDVEKGGDPFTRILFPVANKQQPTHPITPLIHQWNSKNTADKIEPAPMNRSGFYIYNTDGKTKIPLVTPQEKAALQRVIGSNLRTSAATVAENIKANGGELPENFDKVVDKIITAARTDARKTAIQSSPFLAAKKKQP